MLPAFYTLQHEIEYKVCMNKFVLSILLIFSIAGCSSSKDVNSVYFKQFDFEQVNTYSMFDRNTGFRIEQNITDFTRNQIELAIDKSMLARGFNYEETSADIIVSYAVIGMNPGDFSAYNKAVRFCAPCLKSRTWVSTDKSWSLIPGSLVIDLIDPVTKRTVWRNIFPLEVEVEDNSQEVNTKINQAVNVLISKYPTK